MTELYFIIETTRGSSHRYYYCDKLKRLRLRRINQIRFPADYGYVEVQDNAETLKGDKPDFFLISNQNFDPGIVIGSEMITCLGTFECIDERKREKDDKKIIILKEQLKYFDFNKILTELENIRNFLITLRGPFKVKNFKTAEDCPEEIKKECEKINWYGPI